MNASLRVQRVLEKEQLGGGGREGERERTQIQCINSTLRIFKHSEPTLINLLVKHAIAFRGQPSFSEAEEIVSH